MSATFYDLQKYAKTGIASPDMTQYDRIKARAFFGGSYPIATITGVPPISFKSDGTALTAWSIAGNMVQTGTPTPDAPIVPQECGDLVTTGDHAGQYAIPITLAGQTQTVYLSDPLRKIGDYADNAEQGGTITRKIKKMVLTGSEVYILAGTTTIRITVKDYLRTNDWAVLCTHFNGKTAVGSASGVGENETAFLVSASGNNYLYFYRVPGTTSQAFSDWVSEQYAAGTPVTVWYVLATPTTEQITVPTLTPAKGNNILTVGTTLQPSSVSITGHIKQ